MRSTRLRTRAFGAIALASMISFALGMPTRARGGSISMIQLSGDNPVIIKVRGNLSDNSFARDGKGISIAGAKLFNTFPDPSEEWKVSRALGNGNGEMATGAEFNDLTGLHDLTYQILTSKPNSKERGDLQQRFYNAVTSGIVPNQGKFPLVEKKNIGDELRASTQQLRNTAVEIAQATADQVARKLSEGGLGYDAVVVSNSLTAQATPGIVASPTATAVAITKDPFLVGFAFSSSPLVQVDISQLAFQIKTQGLGSSAFGAYDSAVSYYNDSTNLDTPFSSSSPLYNLIFSVSSLGGQSPTWNVSLNTYGNTIYNNLGMQSTAGTVSKDLTDDIMVSRDGKVSFQSPYVFSVQVPAGKTSNTLLFTEDDAYGAAAIATPEPSTLTLFGIGALGLLGYGWRRRKQLAA
jgi:hypothetical protein